MPKVIKNTVDRQIIIIMIKLHIPAMTSWNWHTPSRSLQLCREFTPEELKSMKNDYSLVKNGFVGKLREYVSYVKNLPNCLYDAQVYDTLIDILA